MISIAIVINILIAIIIITITVITIIIKIVIIIIVIITIILDESSVWQALNVVAYIYIFFLIPSILFELCTIISLHIRDTK